MICESSDFVYTSGCDLTPFVKAYIFSEDTPSLDSAQALLVELSVSHTADTDGTPMVLTNTETEMVWNHTFLESSKEDKITSVHLVTMSTEIVTYDKANTGMKYYPIGKGDVVATISSDGIELLGYNVTEYEGAGNLNHTAKLRVFSVNYLEELNATPEP